MLVLLLVECVPVQSGKALEGAAVRLRPCPLPFVFCFVGFLEHGFQLWGPPSLAEGTDFGFGTGLVESLSD